MQKHGEMTDEQTPPQQHATPKVGPLKDSDLDEKKSSVGRTLVLVALCAGIVLGIVWAVQHRRAAAAAKAASPANRLAFPPVPVVAGKVMQQDVPIYLDGIGTVQAFNTVTVHSRVDGQLQKVAYVEGQDVRAGDLLAQIDPEPFRTQVAQAEAKKAEDEAQLANARIQLRRDEDLLASKILAPQDYDTQKALVDQFAATVKADQAAIESAKVQLNYATIVSPLDGRTGIRLMDQGNIVHANDTMGLVVITQLRPVSVVFTLPEQHLSQIQTHLDSGEKLTVIAVGRDNTNTLGKGVLAVVDNQIDTTTGTLRLKATFANENLRLWPGQFVNARLLLTTHKNGTVVPAQVIQRGPDGPYAFVINDEMKATVRPVKVAQIEQGQALIDEGLQPGETVVVDGQYKLQPGSRVKLGDSGPPSEPGRGRPSAKPVNVEQGR